MFSRFSASGKFGCIACLISLAIQAWVWSRATTSDTLLMITIIIGTVIILATLIFLEVQEIRRCDRDADKPHLTLMK